MRAHRVYAKTAQGRDEVAQRSRGLTPRQRSILIMVDGQKGTEALAAMMPAAQLAEVLRELVALQLIAASEPAQGAAPAPPPRSPSGAPAAAALATAAPPPSVPLTAPARTTAPSPAADPARFAQVKAMLIRTADTHLGLMAAESNRKVEAASDENALQRAIGHWHMAMRASKYGKDVADAHLELVKAELHALAAAAG